MPAAPVTIAVAGLLLDMDGVLVDSQAAVEAAWLAWAARRGIEREALMAHAHGSPTTEVMARFVPASEVAAEAAWLEEVNDGTHTEVALPGALRMLTQTDVPVAVATSASRRVATARLARVGLPVPAHLVAAGDVRRGKPDPEPYLRAAELIGIDPHDCLAVDDTPAGTTAARAAGASTAGVTTSHTADLLVDAHYLIRHLDDVELVHGPHGPHGPHGWSARLTTL